MSSAVTLNSVSKCYRLGATAGYRRLSEAVLTTLRRQNVPKGAELWALRDISFSVAEGEVVGIIGPNGAGKSTLLKVISRITRPSEGRLMLRGRVGSLLEVGTGFHPELTGRENIFLNGVILGMRRRDVEVRLDEIVDFAGVSQFLDTPVKRYSSGMYVRLAFAVAAHLEPEILVVDEVLAVGDAAFQRKCLGKMSEVSRSGRTVLFVSHNMVAVHSLCDRGVLLEHGRVTVDADVATAVAGYLASTGPEKAELRSRIDRKGDGGVRVVGLSLGGMQPGSGIRLGEPMAVEIEYEAEAEVRNVQFLVGIYDKSNAGIYLLDSDVRGGLAVLPPRGRVRCTTGPIQITPGPCFVNIAVKIAGGLADHVERASEIMVEAEDPWNHGRVPARDWVLCDVPQSWELCAPA